MAYSGRRPICPFLSSLIVGSLLRLALFYLIPAELAGLDTLIPPVISVIIFVAVALATQKKYPGRYGVVDYVPPEEDVVIGEDLGLRQVQENDFEKKHYTTKCKLQDTIILVDLKYWFTSII